MCALVVHPVSKGESAGTVPISPGSHQLLILNLNVGLLYRAIYGGRILYHSVVASMIAFSACAVEDWYNLPADDLSRTWNISRITELIHHMAMRLMEKQRLRMARVSPRAMGSDTQNMLTSTASVIFHHRGRHSYSNSKPPVRWSDQRKAALKSCWMDGLEGIAGLERVGKGGIREGGNGMPVDDQKGRAYWCFCDDIGQLSSVTVLCAVSMCCKTKKKPQLRVP